MSLRPRQLLSTVLLPLLLAGLAPAQAADAERLAKEIEQAKAVPLIPTPDAATLARTVAKVDGRAISLRTVILETLLRYGMGHVDRLARQHIMRREATRRGVTPTDDQIRAAVGRVLQSLGRGRSLADLLRQTRTDWPRFEAQMRVDAMIAAMAKKDGIDPDDDEAGRAWAQGVMKRYKIRLNPTALRPADPPGQTVFAHVYRADDLQRRSPLAVVDLNQLIHERLPQLKLRHLDVGVEAAAERVAFQAVLAARNVKPSTSRVETRERLTRARYAGELSWERALKLIGRNVWLELRSFEDDDAIDQLIGTAVDDDTLRQYYDSRPDHFGRATVTASHILVRKEDPTTGRVDDAAAKKAIREAHEKLRGGARFIDLVQTYSEDQASRRRGGDVGLFTLESAYDPAFCRLAFTLRAGEASPPVRTRQGWHIIFCRERTAPDLETYSFDRIRDQVRADRQTDLRRRWLDENVKRGLTIERELDAIAAPFLAVSRVATAGG